MRYAAVLPAWKSWCPLGVIMALYGVVYAVLENDCRRLLAYHIISQVGYMVAGVGLGTAMAINGACAHAFAHILYKGLLFMGCGAVLHMTGESKFTELGGLWKKMPWTFVFTLIGGLSISAFPLFSGFVSKSMIVAAGFEEHKILGRLSADARLRRNVPAHRLESSVFHLVREKPAASRKFGIARRNHREYDGGDGDRLGLCIFIGCYTPYLYQMLPYPVDYQPYTAYHISETLQILLFTGVGFFLLSRNCDPSRHQPRPRLVLSHGRTRLSLGGAQARPGLGYLRGRTLSLAGLVPLMYTARLAGLFDNDVIDGLWTEWPMRPRTLAAGSALAQRGQMQENLAFAFGVAAVLIVAFVIYSYRSMNSSAITRFRFERADFQPAVAPRLVAVLHPAREPAPLVDAGFHHGGGALFAAALLPL